MLDLNGRWEELHRSRFGAASKLGSGSWELDNCPVDGGYLAATGPGQVTTVWRCRKQIFQADLSRRSEQLLESGEQPCIAGSAQRAWIVWLSKRGGHVWLASPGAKQPGRLAAAATDPAIAAPRPARAPSPPLGKTGKGRNTRIMARVVGD